MRFLLLFLLISCSTPLKYKYSSSQRYLASLTDDSIKVAKVQLSLKDSLVFASGMDSTSLIVQLYDEDGALITSIDPSDLTLSSSEDIKAKPFAMKQGVYKAELLPRVKSPHIQMQVDWQDKVKSNVVVLKLSLIHI